MPATRRFQFGLRALLGLVLVLCVSLAVVTTVHRSARETSNAWNCRNYLRSIGLALHNYHDKNNSFPPAHTFDADGEPNHSWRMLVTPYLESNIYYDMYRFDQRWDSQHNQDIFTKPVPSPPGWSDTPGTTIIIGHQRIFHCPAQDDVGSPWSSYVLITGPGTAFPDDGCVALDDITDGTANTIIAVEIDQSKFHWLSPSDLDVRTMSFRVNDSTRPSISSRHKGAAHVLFADASVWFVSEEIDADTLRALFTIAGGETVDLKALSDRGVLRLRGQE